MPLNGLIAYVDKALTALGYVAFLGLLALLAWAGDPFLPRCLVVAGLSFVLVSLMRKFIHAPRPYELSESCSAIAREKTGDSFPSRHVFCMFMIAMCWLRWMPFVGAILLAAGAAVAAVRVLGGVHFVRDVVAGALIGITCGILGFWVVP